MSSTAFTAAPPQPRPVATRSLLWVGIHAAVAALAMVATLPGRTHGLGLITEPLLHDLGLGRSAYAAINLWATLLGALFCLPCGWLLDRLGVRPVLSATLGLLGGVVLVMSRVSGDWIVSFGPSSWGIEIMADLFVLVLLTRGLGQSALSVVSLALVGKAAGRRSGPVIGFYSLMTALGFMAAFSAVKYADEILALDWRTLWASIGVALLLLAPLGWLLVRPAQLATSSDDRTHETAGHTLGQALLSPAFWVFALATSLYGLIAAGLSLFNQSILAERGFERSTFLTITAVMPLIGLASNVTTGLLAARCSMGKLLAAAMLLLAAALVYFPFVTTLAEVYAYAAVLGIAGGMVTVLFFAVWSQAFGTAHLGTIQGAAQMLTVLASALGPQLLAWSHEANGSYLPLFRAAAAVAALFGVVAWFVPLPRPASAPAPTDERITVLPRGSA